ncbi:MAG: diacylglycerol kinase family lipid kinase [Prevotellaceae bacterium]|jgi:YegS/Rv2252/BmrU family lipid kinase|nr:diacylglycerol kinase family lipid kinase [Prevotellaceae bacterium]
MRKIAFIMNPVSGTGSKRTLWKHIGEAFGLLPDYETLLYTTQYAGDGYRQAKRYAEAGYDAVVAIGGDGTINEVARALMHTPTALGIVPTGSGNGLARHLKIPMNTKKAIRRIKRFRVQPVDAARINDKIFFCTAGIGFDALVGHLFNTSKRRGLSKYIQYSTSAFLRYTPQEYRLCIDGQEIIRTAFLITFANASQWGNNAYVAPLADTRDGTLDIVVWKNVPRSDLPFMLPKLFTKSLHRSRHIDTFRGRHITVERIREDYVHFDGESCTMGKALDVEIIPHSLKILF